MKVPVVCPPDGTGPRAAAGATAGRRHGGPTRGGGGGGGEISVHKSLQVGLGEADGDAESADA